MGCLFPQHGPGRKHKRKIELEGWQLGAGHGITVAVPAGLHPLRRVRVHQPHGHPPAAAYEYLSYHFGNLSKDITDIFRAACGLAGVHDYRVSGKAGRRWAVRINRRASVALMVERVGLKS